MMFKCSLVVFNRCVLRVGLVGLRRLHFARPGGHTRWLVQTVEGADFRRPQTRTFTWPRAVTSDDDVEHHSASPGGVARQPTDLVRPPGPTPGQRPSRGSGPDSPAAVAIELRLNSVRELVRCIEREQHCGSIE